MGAVRLLNSWRSEAGRNSGNWGKALFRRRRCSRLSEFRTIESRVLITDAIAEL